MTLLDHFHPPLGSQRRWHGFHHSWACAIAADLNTRLPSRYYAEPHVEYGVEIDVAALEKPEFDEKPQPAGDAVAEALNWQAPAPTLTIPFPSASDIVEVRVFDQSAGPQVAGAIELVSPSNKDRPTSRDAFATKCRAYLQEGVGLIIVDVVTERRANLHNALLDLVGEHKAGRIDADLYACSYHPVQRQGEFSLDIWPEVLTLGASLPTLPLWLKAGLAIPVELDVTYRRTCRELRIDISPP